MRVRGHAAALVLALGAAACGGAPRDEPDAQSEYVDLHLDDGIEVCAGQLPAYDDFLTRALELWNGEVPDGFNVAVFAEHEADCEIGFSCAPDGEARLGGQFGQYHELAHLVHREIDGRSVPALEEGVAEALGPGDPFVIEQSWLADATLEFLFAQRPEDTSSAHAAILSRYLIDEYGAEAFRSYFRAMAAAEDPSADDFRREFEAAFAGPLDDAWSEVVSQDRCPYDLWYCEPWDPVELPYSVDGIDCDAPGTLGFKALDYAKPNVPYKPMRIVHIEADTPATIVLGGDDIAHVTGLAVAWARCGACAPIPAPALAYDDPSCRAGQPCEPIALELTLEAGRYAFIFEQFPDEPSLRLRCRRSLALESVRWSIAYCLRDHHFSQSPIVRSAWCAFEGAILF